MQFRIPSFSDWLTESWLYRKLDWTEKGRYWFAWRPVFLEDKQRYAWLERVQVHERWHNWKSTVRFDLGFFVNYFYYSKDWRE
jgi:hypothetical protein